MKTSRVTRRVVRRWAMRLRKLDNVDLAFTLRLAVPARERDVLGALVVREFKRRIRLAARMGQ